MPENQKKILIIEDDEMLRDVYKEFLVSSGFVVDTAVNGEEGMLKIGTFSPDLILLDIFLPKMSGFDIIEKLKQDPMLSKIPIIVLTNIYIDKEELINKGVERCLIKAEVTPDIIVGKIHEIFNAPAK